MKDSQNLEEVFKTSITKGVVTGTLKFSNLYCSQIQVFKVAYEWSQEDEAVVYASVRPEGDFVCLDLRYDENIHKDKPSAKSILYDFFKPLFEKKLGGDYLQSWSIAREGSIIIK